MTEFSATISADNNPYSQHKAKTVSSMTIGDPVRYKQEFLSSHTGISYPFADIANLTGEIIDIRHNGRLARIKWDDGHESSSLLTNIETLDIADRVPSTGDDYQAELLNHRLEFYVRAYTEFFGVEKLEQKLSALHE